MQVDVELGPADLDELVEVELDESLPVPFDRGRSGDEHTVIGFDLIRDHGDLVALTVVEVHVDHRRVAERLEVAHAVVDVERHLRVESEVEVLQRIEPSFEDERKRCRLSQLLERARRSEDDGDPVGPVELFEDGDPLEDLIDLRRAVAEVGDDRCLEAGAVEFGSSLSIAFAPRIQRLVACQGLDSSAASAVARAQRLNGGFFAVSFFRPERMCGGPPFRRS